MTVGDLSNGLLEWGITQEQCFFPTPIATLGALSTTVPDGSASGFRRDQSLTEHFCSFQHCGRASR